MQLDLNLLTALDALLEEGSVTAAADRLHLSTPAMSRTLGRIRRATGDQVLVRTGRTMTPTPYALAVREQVHLLLAQAHAVLTPAREVDLSTLERTFTLQCHDAITTAIGAALIAVVHDRAPGVRLRLLAEASTDTDDLRHGRVDLEIGSSEPTLPEIRCKTLGHDHLLVVARADHPATRGQRELQSYADALHVTVSRRGRLRDPLDDALATLGLTRRVVASAPTSTAALHLVAETELLVTVPERMCRTAVDALGLRTRPLPPPLEPPPVPLRLAWHQRYDTDPAHTWLREQVRDTLHAAFP